MKKFNAFTEESMSFAQLMLVKGGGGDEVPIPPKDEKDVKLSGGGGKKDKGK